MNLAKNHIENANPNIQLNKYGRTSKTLKQESKRRGKENKLA